MIDLMSKILELPIQDGTTKVQISTFPAMTGWDLQRQYITFAASDAKNDRDFRRAFTLEILTFAKVLKDNREIPLTTDALIDNHLQTWENVERVFKAVLLQNGIDPDTHADRTNYWAKAGGEMAVAFIAECSKLMGPAFESVAKVVNSGE